MLMSKIKFIYIFFICYFLLGLSIYLLTLPSFKEYLWFFEQIVQGTACAAILLPVYMGCYSVDIPVRLISVRCRPLLSWRRRSSADHARLGAAWACQPHPGRPR